MAASFENIHRYYKSLDMERQVNDICKSGEPLTFAVTKKLDLTPGFIYVPVEGSVAILHAESELTIGNAIDFMPIGLMERYCPLLSFEYKCMTPVKVVKISYENFDGIFFQSTENMQVLSNILIFMTIFSLELHAERKQLTSYQTIKPMLYRYLYRAKTYPKESEGLANFIIRRTKLSRTHVFRVLADLKEGGYITMKNGKLVSINKVLPDGY
ncbi:helix-turn-helix domain-containing protein [Buttiauxella agrestis]|uniref:helix-turn-helix domain-containing protein n=1 Tax=Buttiauxella agrestis TaxID=82977 RepID=UPI00155FF0CA|nr:helix-turn-helix domain-containing protein [Buttiauxella agrestis]BCG10505.1 Crp/Fnr family transcriptional regulator [Buttiauxella agrestis]